MASRNSNQDTDGIVYSTASLKLGTQGLDLRRPADPAALTKLLNARFLDEKTIERRHGHRGVLVQDGSAFPPVGNSITPTEWVYGHGLLTSEVGPNNQQDAHHPIAGRGGVAFDFNGAVVAWTGDRLMTLREGATALGGSRFWYRRTIDNNGGAIDTTKDLAQGIPAFLPLQTDTNPPNALITGSINTCLTRTLRVTADTSGGTGVNAWTTSRNNGAVIHHGDISGASNAPFDVRVVNSGETPVALWRDTADNNLYWCHWTGRDWTAAAVLVGSVATFDVIPVSGGFHVFYRTGAVIKAIKFSGITTQTNPYSVNTVVITTGSTPNGAIAATVDPAGNIAVVWEDSTKLNIRAFKPDLTNWDNSVLTTLVTTTLWHGGVSVVSRGLINSAGTYDFVVHASAHQTGVTYVLQYRPTSDGGWLDTTVTTRYGCHLASKSFRVGNEVFCWLTAETSMTNFLLAGFFLPVVAGYCDREESFGSTDGDGVTPMVLPDPLDDTGTKLSWARRINTGQTFARGGDARIGDLDFLPHPTVARYGKSAYLSGSAVRNWDGVTLADAGFQDYPTINSFSQGTGGSLTLLGVYNFRAYAVRYNALGERFESAAITKGVTLTGANNKLTAVIIPVTATSHDDVVIEVYRTEANGTTFYLDGTIANNLTSTVSYVSTIADSALRNKPADPHATGIGNLSELESFGPLGCSLLASAGDRLWGAGGQVPAGEVQFSKLWTQGFAAGFDDLAGYQVVDIEGGTINSIAAFNDAIVIQEIDRISVFGGGGPDNFGSGTFSTPEIRLADGASNSNGTALVPAGLVYWGSDGPRILESNFQTECICSPVRSLTTGLVPTGVHVDFVREEVVWYTSSGTAILWNYRGNSRWAEWSGLRAADAQEGLMITPEGLVLIADEVATSDAGNRFEFAGSSGNVRPEEILSGSTMIRRAGINGEFNGDHQLRFRVFYNGSPLWSEEVIWQPTVGTWLTSAETVSALTPAQVDLLNPTDHSGAYATHKRLSREECRYFRFEFSDMGSYTPTFTPYELVFEMGGKPGLGRVPVNTFTDG